MIKRICLRICVSLEAIPSMVQHNDKWKKKATREYHKKHGTFPVGRGRGRGRGAIVENELASEVSEENIEENEEDDGNELNVESGNESAKEEKESRRERSKYSRRKIQSNAWRFESEEPDPYLVIDETALEPPEPDYAHLPARPFETKKQLSNPVQSSTGVSRGKKLTIKETELAPLKAQIEKANAARAFKERFGSGQKGNVLSIGEDGIARRQQRVKPDEEVNDEIDDIDSFLAELDMHKDTKPLPQSAGKSVQAHRPKDRRPDLDSFVDSLI